MVVRFRAARGELWLVFSGTLRKKNHDTVTHFSEASTQNDAHTTTTTRSLTMAPTALPAEVCAEARTVLATPLFEVLRSVASLPSPKKETLGGRHGEKPKVLTLDHNTSLSDALAKLSRHHILGAPVLIQPDPLHADEIHTEHYDDSVGRERPVLLGFFDVGDALRALVRALPEEEDEKIAVPSSPRQDEVNPPFPVPLPTGHGRNTLSWMRVLHAVEHKVANTKLISLLGDDAELLYKADSNSAGHTFLQTISDGFLDKKSANGAVHRIAVFDATGEMCQIISMSDAVRFLAANVDKLKTLANVTLRDLGLVTADDNEKTKNLETVPPTTPAIEAFTLMVRSGVSGVGVLDDKGKLIANVSVSDMRTIEPEHFGVLGLPIAEYLALTHGTSYAGFSGTHSESSEPSSPTVQLRRNPFFAKMNEGGFRKSGPYLVTVAPDTKFGDLLKVIYEHRVHRVYVCEHELPIDVVTLTDVLRKVRQLATEEE